MDRACGTGLRLHLNHAHLLAEQVLLALGSHFIHVLSHG